jgi:Protein of unknown function (DUF3703)
MKNMSVFSKKIAPFVNAEIILAKTASEKGQFEQQFRHLERAHVLGQCSTYQHVRIHVLMLFWGFQQTNAKEVIGQCLRIIGAATKTVFGLIPTGNTGGTNISPFKSLPIPKDLQNIILKAYA